MAKRDQLCFSSSDANLIGLLCCGGGQGSLLRIQAVQLNPACKAGTVRQKVPPRHSKCKFVVSDCTVTECKGHFLRHQKQRQSLNGGLLFVACQKFTSLGLASWPAVCFELSACPHKVSSEGAAVQIDADLPAFQLHLQVACATCEALRPLQPGSCAQDKG